MKVRNPLISACFCFFILAGSSSHAVTREDEPAKPQQAGASKVAPSGKAIKTPEFVVTSILFDGMDDNYIYSQDGRKFARSHETKIIRKHEKSKLRTAQLFFRDGTLISVVIK